MTINERAKEKELYEIAIENNKNSNPDLKNIFLVLQPLWDQKVIKVRKKKKVSPVRETLNS